MSPSLTLADVYAISPLLILIVGALALLVCESAKIEQKFTAILTCATLVMALCAVYFLPYSDNTLLATWLRFDRLASLFSMVFILIGISCVLLASAFFTRFESNQGEYYFLLLSAIFGLILIGQAADFLTLFLGFETLSIALYVMCGYIKTWKISHEASLKYFFLGSFAAALLLYGIALIYGATGSTQFNSLVSHFNGTHAAPETYLFLAGIALVTVGLAFKAAIFPFHIWAPDVYEGASTPVTAFMAVGTKVGVFAAFIRVFFDVLQGGNGWWNESIALLAYPTLIFANFVALRQVQLRRFFAYSGISHAGFLLIPLAAGTADATSALLFYLIVYALATLGCFAILAILDQRSDGVILKDLKGLFYKNQLLAFIFGLCLLTLAGVPPTAGFFAKLYIFKAAFQAGYYGLVIVGLLTTILSIYYYTRMITLMLTPEEIKGDKVVTLWQAAAVGIIATGALSILSVYPLPLLDFVNYK